MNYVVCQYEGLHSAANLDVTEDSLPQRLCEFCLVYYPCCVFTICPTFHYIHKITYIIIMNTRSSSPFTDEETKGICFGKQPMFGHHLKCTQLSPILLCIWVPTMCSWKALKGPKMVRNFKGHLKVIWIYAFPSKGCFLRRYMFLSTVCNLAYPEIMFSARATDSDIYSVIVIQQTGSSVFVT